MSGLSPPKAVAGVGASTKGVVALGRIIVDVIVVWSRREPVAARAVMFRGRQRQTREETRVPVGGGFAVLQRVVVRGEELEPTLHARVGSPHFG